VEIKEAKVGGCISQGMLCDAPMLGWTGGGAGNAALVPDSFEPGDSPPERRPRMDGKADGAHLRPAHSPTPRPLSCAPTHPHSQHLAM
jgi:hypothetical protein